MSDELILSSDCLLSKFGFNDGDMPDRLMDWLDDHHPDFKYDVRDWHPVLVRLVRQHLVPLLKEPAEIYEIGTSHNPIRANPSTGTHAFAELVEVRVPYDQIWPILQELNRDS